MALRWTRPVSRYLSGRCGSTAGSLLPRGLRCRSTATEAMKADVVRDDVRNVAIVAHVDHGKTTLVDALMQETQATDALGKDDRIMDSNDQERERGITILAKNAAVTHKGIKINIVDTPGHADFGGEVERVLSMVDGVLLVVDAGEGPKPQTRFVLKKALGMGHKVLVVLNKIDKPAAVPDEVVNKTFDLFCELGASDEQTDFEVVYTSAINRIAGRDYTDMAGTMLPLLDAILDLPKPPCDVEAPLQLQISNIGSDQFIGRLAIGRIKSGLLRKGSAIALSRGPGTDLEAVKVSEIFMFDAMTRVSTDEASAGDIVTVAGIQNFNIGDTLVDPSDPQPLEPIAVEQPTMSITMGVNKSPFSGKSGAKFLTSRQIKDRLEKELETNVALQVKPSKNADSVQVFGRGLLHLTVLIESMRREGFELMVGCPQVLYKEENGKKLEPYELVDVEAHEEVLNPIVALLTERKGAMLEMGVANSDGLVSVQFEIPSRTMVGVKSKLLTLSRGNAVMTSTYAGYKPYAGDYGIRALGNLLASETGLATQYALEKAMSRGKLFTRPGDDVYKNQIVGVHAKSTDLVVNVCKKKELTNFRTTMKEESIALDGTLSLTLEQAVEYVADDEFVEITPQTIRLGKMENSSKGGKQK